MNECGNLDIFCCCCLDDEYVGWCTFFCFVFCLLVVMFFGAKFLCVVECYTIKEFIAVKVGYWVSLFLLFFFCYLVCYIVNNMILMDVICGGMKSIDDTN